MPKKTEKVSKRKKFVPLSPSDIADIRNEIRKRGGSGANQPAVLDEVLKERGLTMDDYTEALRNERRR